MGLFWKTKYTDPKRLTEDDIVLFIKAVAVNDQPTVDAYIKRVNELEEYAKLHKGN